MKRSDNVVYCWYTPHMPHEHQQNANTLHHIDGYITIMFYIAVIHTIVLKLLQYTLLLHYHEG